MLVVSNQDSSGNLLLSAYSYEEKELDSVLFALKKYAISFDYRQIERDVSDRIGRQYIVPSRDVVALGKRLDGRFDDNGTFIPDEVSGGDEGKHFACRQITFDGTGLGCVDVLADDEDDAALRCALVANKQKWLGDVPSPGTCSI